MDGRPGLQEALLGQDARDVSVIDLGEVHTVILGAHNDRTRPRGPDPYTAHSEGLPRGDEADRETRVDRARGTQDRLGVTGEASGVGEASGHESADRHRTR